MSLPYRNSSFQKPFLLIVNEDHFSNSTETTKFVEETIIPYVDGTRANLMLVFDVFRGLTSREAIDLLDENTFSFPRYYRI